jgi:hypothetical protein
MTSTDVSVEGNKVSSTNPFPVTDAAVEAAILGVPAASDINAGFLSHTATTAAATLLTVPAGKVWVGEVVISCALSKAAAASGEGVARGVIATAGANVTPPAGTRLACEAKAGANAATGVVGTQGNNSVRTKMIVVAPAGNAVTLTLASTITNATAGVVDASAIGTNSVA